MKFGYAVDRKYAEGVMQGRIKKTRPKGGLMNEFGRTRISEKDFAERFKDPLVSRTISVNPERVKAPSELEVMRRIIAQRTGKAPGIGEYIVK